MSTDHVRPILEAVGATEGNEGKVKVITSTLQNVFGKEEVRSLPLVVISINGRQRSGKSFMLTQFLKYLSSPNDPDWVNKSTCGKFTWSGGTERVTPGIQIWTEPIIVEVEDDNGGKRKVAVFLMDCQGLFDSKTTMTQNSKLFAFSALLSSIFIFNDDKGLGDDVLGFIHSFLQYAKFAEASSNQSKIAVFQNLVMLVRDWMNDQEDSGYTPYKCGYYDDNSKPPEQTSNLKSDTFEGTETTEFTSDAMKIRRGILNSFQHTGMYAMAGPGESSALPKPSETSAVKWNRKFRDCVVDFVTHTLNLRRLNSCTKRLGRDLEITGDVLLQMSAKWGDVLMKDDGLKIPATILDTMIDAYFQEKVASAMKRYNCDMTSAFSRFPKGLTAAQFSSSDANAKAAAMLLLGSPDICLGSIEDFDRYKRQLEAKIMQSKASFSATNDLNIQLERNRQEVEAERAHVARQEVELARKEAAFTKKQLEAIRLEKTFLAQKLVDKATEDLNRAMENLQIVQQKKPKPPIKKNDFVSQMFYTINLHVYNNSLIDHDKQVKVAETAIAERQQELGRAKLVLQNATEELNS